MTTDNRAAALSFAVLTPSRGLVHSRTIEAVQANVAEAVAAGHEYRGWVLSHDLPLPECHERVAEMDRIEEIEEKEFGLEELIYARTLHPTSLRDAWARYDRADFMLGLAWHFRAPLGGGRTIHVVNQPHPKGGSTHELDRSTAEVGGYVVRLTGREGAEASRRLGRHRRNAVAREVHALRIEGDTRGGRCRVHRRTRRDRRGGSRAE